MFVTLSKIFDCNFDSLRVLKVEPSELFLPLILFKIIYVSKSQSAVSVKGKRIKQIDYVPLRENRKRDNRANT